MKTALGIFLATALVVVGASQASAATLASTYMTPSVSYGLTDSIGVANVNINALAEGTKYVSGIDVGSGVTMDVGNATIVHGDVDGQYKRPLGVGPNDKYLSILGTPITGMATFTVNSNVNTLAFSWATIDSFNKLEVWDKNNEKYTIDGNMLDAILPSIDLGTTGHYFTFTALDGISKFVLSSTTNSFEAANFRVSNVPLPAALPMLGLAVLGLAGLRTSRRKT